jgi:ABC-type molybdate transport system permease subunit
MKMQKIKRFLRRLRSRLLTCAAMVYIALLIPQSAYAADDVSNSKIVKGTEKLISDVTTWLMVLAPIVSGLLIIYFCIRRSAADEMDQKKWNNRIVVAIVSCIGAVLGSATLNLILGYYK